MVSRNEIGGLMKKQKWPLSFPHHRSAQSFSFSDRHFWYFDTAAPIPGVSGRLFKGKL
jgi:hypothetical protein